MPKFALLGFLILTCSTQSLADNQHKIVPTASSSSGELPAIISGVDGPDWIQLAKSVDGVSTNQFDEFSLVGTPPILKADSNTKKVVININGEKTSQFSETRDIGVLAKKDALVSLVFRSTAGFICSGCSFLGLNVAFEKGDFLVNGAGMNATHGLNISTKHVTQINSPLLVADTFSVDGDFSVASSVYAKDVKISGAKQVDITGKLLSKDRVEIQSKTLAVDGIIQGLLIDLDTESLVVAPPKVQFHAPSAFWVSSFPEGLVQDPPDLGHKSGIFAQAPADSNKIYVAPHTNRHLKINAGGITNFGVLASEGQMDLNITGALRNFHRIESADSMQITGKALSNSKGIIASQADLTFGSEQNRLNAIENYSGTLRSKGKLRIFSDALKNSRLGLAAIEKSKVQNKQNTYKVNACFVTHCEKHNAKEIENAQELVSDLSRSSLGLISSSGGIDLHCKSIHNSISRIESQGDVWLDDKLSPEILVEGLRLKRQRSLNFIDLYVPPSSLQYYQIGPSLYEQAIQNGAKNLWANPPPSAGALAYFQTHSPTLSTIEAQNKDTIHITRLDAPFGKTSCKKVSATEKSWSCEPNYSPISADLIYGGKVFGGPKSIKLYEWVKPEKGRWIRTEKSAQWRKEQITIQDQMIPIVDSGSLQRLIEMESFAHLLGPHLPEISANTNSTAVLWADSANYLGMSSIANIAASIPHRALAPAVEYRALMEVLAIKVGHSDVTPSELLKNTPRAMEEYNFGFGQCPDSDQIQNAHYPFLCSGFYEDPQNPTGKVLIPIAVIPRDLVAKWRSEKAAQLTGEVVDLTIEGDAHIDGVIKALKGALKLRAENLVLHGEISAEGDISLHANKQLLLESIVDEVTNTLKQRTKVQAKGSIKASSGGDFKAVGSEVSGENIVVRAEGEMIIIPTHVFEDLTNSFNEGGLSVQQRLVCESLYGNLWTAANGDIDISAPGATKIEGGEFTAKNNINIKSEKSTLDLKPTKDKCDEVLKKSGLFYSYERKTKTEDVEKFKFTADNINAHSKEDMHLTSVEMNAKAVNLTSDGNITIDSVKSTKAQQTTEDSFCLLCFTGIGVSLFEITSSVDRSYDENIASTFLNAGNIDIKSKGRVNTKDLDYKANGTVRIVGEKGVFNKNGVELHENFRENSQWGLFIGLNINPGEFSAGVGISSKSSSTSTRREQPRSGLWTAQQTILFSDGDIQIQGNIIGNVEINAQNISMLASKGQICVETKELSWELGVRAGIKSRLTRALAKALQLKDSEIKVWEDGVNLGFRVLASGMEISSGLLMPTEGGIWFHGEAQNAASESCFDFVSIPSLQGNDISLTAAQCIELEAAQINGVNGNIKAKCLKVRSAKKESSSSGGHVNVEADIKIKGSTTSSVSGEGGGNKTSSTQHINSRINFDSLKIRVEEKASFEGAVVKAKVLDAEFGELLIKSLQDISSLSGFSLGISANPAKLAESLSGILGGGLGGKAHSTSVVRELTVLLGTNSATVVVSGLATVVGAMIANAEKNTDGSYTDKGNLIFKASKLIYEDIKNHNHGIDVDLHVSQGFDKAVKATVEPTFGFAAQGSTTKATIGLGKLEITDVGDDGFDLKNLNRDVNKAESEFSGPILNPIRAYIPVLNFDDDGKHIANFFKAIAECATGTTCFANSLDEIWRSMSWFKTPGKLSKSQEEWRALLKNYDFLDEAEREKILKEVENETRPIEDKIAQELANNEGDAEKDRNTELAKDLLNKARDASFAAKVLDAESKSKYKKANSKTDAILASLSAERMLAHADHLVGSTDDAVSKYLREVIGWEFWNTVQTLDLELSAEQKAIMAFTASLVDSFEKMRFNEVSTRIEVLSQFENYILSLLKVYGGAYAIRAARAPGIGLYMAIPCFILGFDSIQSGFSSIAKKEQQELATIRALEIAGMSGNWVHALDLAMAVGTLRGIPEHLVVQNKKNAEIIIRALEKSSRAKLGKRTGTIWDFIKATQPVPKGSLLPKSFELIAGKTKVWVSPNAVEHITERTAKLFNLGVNPRMIELSAQFQLKSLAEAVYQATKNGIIYNKKYQITGWELVFSPPKKEGLLPALIHALWKS